MNETLQIVEGNLVEVPTEDGLGYYPDLEVISVIDGRTFIAPVFFSASETNLRDAEEYVKTAKVDETWTEYKKPQFSYSQGNDEPFDDEELHYMRR